MILSFFEFCLNFFGFEFLRVIFRILKSIYFHIRELFFFKDYIELIFGTSSPFELILYGIGNKRKLLIGFEER